jgi:hypothetical protein
MSTYTPGPWMVVEDQVGDDDGNVIADVTQFNQWNTTEGMVTEHMPWEANAKLIAAAPELLDALRVLYEACLAMETVPFYKALRNARDLIAKLPAK